MTGVDIPATEKTVKRPELNSLYRSVTGGRCPTVRLQLLDSPPTTTTSGGNYMIRVPHPACLHRHLLKARAVHQTPPKLENPVVGVPQVVPRLGHADYTLLDSFLRPLTDLGRSDRLLRASAKKRPWLGHPTESLSLLYCEQGRVEEAQKMSKRTQKT